MEHSYTAQKPDFALQTLTLTNGGTWDTAVYKLAQCQANSNTLLTATLENPGLATLLYRQDVSGNRSLKINNVTVPYVNPTAGSTTVVQGVKTSTGWEAWFGNYPSTALIIDGNPVKADTFDGDGSMAGRTPTTGGGTWEVYDHSAANALSMTTSSGLLGYAVGAAGAKHHVLNVGIRNVSSRIVAQAFAPAPSVFLILAFTDKNNFLQVDIYSGAVYQVINGASTTLFGGTGTTAVAQIFEAILNNTTLQVYRGTTLLTTQTVSNALTSTKHGILNFNDTGTKVDKIDFYAV